MLKSYQFITHYKADSHSCKTVMPCSQTVPSMPWYCWLAGRSSGLQNISFQQWGSSLTWSDLLENSPVKQKTKVETVVVAIVTQRQIKVVRGWVEQDLWFERTVIMLKFCNCLNLIGMLHVLQFVGYHRTIKAVVSSTQVSIPTLLRHLLQLVHVRTLTSHHAAFDRHLKQPVGAPKELCNYRPLLSRFAFELVSKEYVKGSARVDADNQADDEQEDFVEPCQCWFACTYNLPCRHYFTHCLRNHQSVFNPNFVDPRWAPLPTQRLTVLQSAAGSIQQLTVPQTFNTQQQRYRLAASVCTSNYCSHSCGSPGLRVRTSASMAEQNWERRTPRHMETRQSSRARDQCQSGSTGTSNYGLILLWALVIWIKLIISI